MRRLVLASVLLWVWGCGGDDGFSPISEVPRDQFAQVFSQSSCRLWTLQCDCNRDVFGGYDSCVAASISYLEDQYQMAENAGMIYSPQCAASLINVLELDIACNRESDIVGNPLQALNRPYCKPFYGEALEGEPCESFPAVQADSCEQGLQCLGGTCFVQQEPRTLKLDGEVCDPETDVCELGTLCTFDDAGGTSCIRQPTAGEPCVGSCDVGFYCDSVDNICKTPPGQGEPCAPNSLTAPECGESTYCDETDTCVPITPAGQPCSGEGSDECGAFMECLEQDGNDERFICGPEQALICI